MINDQKKQAIEAALAEMQPFIIRHGGFVTVEKITDEVIFIRLHGACVNCPASIYTVELGLKQAFQKVVPEIQKVIVLGDE